MNQAIPQARVLQGTIKIARPRARGNIVDPPWMIQNSHLLYLPQLVDARLGVDPIHHCIVCVEYAYALPLSLHHFKDKHSPALFPNNFAQILEQNGEVLVSPTSSLVFMSGSINLVVMAKFIPAF